MVRTIREPNPTTPQILRISTSSASSSRRSSAEKSPSQPIFIRSKATYLNSSQNSNGGGTVRRRAVLGERHDNIMSPSSPRTIKSKPKQKSKSKTSLTPRQTARPTSELLDELSDLSRFVAKSPINKLPPPARFDIPSSSPMRSSPNNSSMSISRPGSTPYLPRRSMPMQLTEDDTLLLNMGPPDMGMGDMTDESDMEDMRGGVLGRGGLMTPAASQEVSACSPQRTQTIQRPVEPLSTTRNSISRLPTPPSSQNDFQAPLPPPTPQAGPSRVSRVRARPSPTPPRRISIQPVVVGLGDVTAEWDTPLRLGDDISPNPRRKKSPRLSQPGQTPTKQRSPFAQQQKERDRVEVVIPIRARSNTPGKIVSNTPATVKAKTKPRVSSRTPSVKVSQSSRRTSGGSRRTSEGSTKLTTPPNSRVSKKVPSTAPAGRRKSTPPSTTSRKSPNLSSSQSNRRASVPANTKTPKGRGRPRNSVAQTPRDVALTGRKLGMLPRPILGSPGDDPLLLKGRDDRLPSNEGVRDGTGLSLIFSQSSTSNADPTPRARQESIPTSSPFNFEQDEDDLTLLPMGNSIGNDNYYDPGPAWSDDGSDMEGVGEDTFIHVHQRRENSGMIKSVKDSIVMEEDESEDDQGDITAETTQSPLLPPRRIELSSIENTELDERAIPAEPIADDSFALEEQRLSPVQTTSRAISVSGDDIVIQEIKSLLARSAHADQGNIIEVMGGHGVNEIDWSVPQEVIAPVESELFRDNPPEEEDDTGDATPEMEGDKWNISEEHIEPQTLQEESSTQAIIGGLSVILAEQPEAMVVSGEDVDSLAHKNSLVTLPNRQAGDQPEEGEADITQEIAGLDWDISTEDIQTQSPLRPLSPAGSIVLEEQEEIGDVTQDMDVLDWEVSEGDIQPQHEVGAGTREAIGLSRSTGLGLQLEGDYEEGSIEIVQEENHEEREIPNQDAQQETESEIADSERSQSALPEIKGDATNTNDNDTQDEIYGEPNLSEEDVVVPVVEQERIVLSETPFDDEEEDVTQERESDQVNAAAGEVQCIEAEQGGSNEDAIARPENESKLDQTEASTSHSPEEDLYAQLEIEISRSSDTTKVNKATPSRVFPSISISEASEPDQAVPKARSPTPALAYRSTTPLFSPPPSFEPLSLRSPTVPKSPFVLIHHRGDLTLTPTPAFSLFNPRSPSPLPHLVSDYPIEGKGDRILEEADRALRRLSKVRSLSPLAPTISNDGLGETHQDVKLQETVNASAHQSVEGDEDSAPSILDVTPSKETQEEAPSATAINHLQESGMQISDKSETLEEDGEEQQETNSTVGDLTLEADNSAWNISSEEYDVPLRDESDDEQEHESQEEQVDENSSTQVLAVKNDDANSAQSDQGENRHEAQEEQEEDISPEPVEVPERIILCLVERGVIKLEPESDDEDNSEEDSSSEQREVSLPIEAKSSPSPLATPSLVTGEGLEARGRSSTRSPGPAHSPLAPSTPPIQTSSSSSKTLPQQQTSTPQMTPPSSMFRSANLTPQRTPLLGRMGGTSKLCQQILPSSPSTEATSSSAAQSPARHRSTSGLSDEQIDESSEPIEDEADQSVIIRKPRRSLHDELAAVAADEEGNEGDESFRSVVEVSSLDPKAAARAAAILKLNHSYIEHGVLSRSKTQDLTSTSFPSSSTRFFSGRRKSTAYSDVEKRELLNEAELEIVQSQRSRSRSRSKSRVRERELSVMSFMTENYPVPGSFIKTPQQNKRKWDLALSSLVNSGYEAEQPQNEGESESEREADLGEQWGVSEWKKLEKVYRNERETWIKERNIKNLPMPGGLISWARRSTFGHSPDVKEWDIQRVVETFLRDEKKDGNKWDREMLLLRIQAIEKRVNRLASSTASSLNSSVDRHTPNSKKPKIDSVQTPSNTNTDSRRAIEPPSTIRRMIGLVWGKSKLKSNKSGNADDGQKDGQNLLDRFQKSIEAPAFTSSSNQLTNKGKGKAVTEEILPTSQMREVRSSNQTVPPHPASSQWTPVPPPRQNNPCHPPKSRIDAPVTENTVNASSNFSFSTSISSMTNSLDTSYSYKRLYPPLEPSLTQRSDALARLFPNPLPSTSSENLNRATSKDLQTVQKKRSGSVTSLREKWEGKGVIARGNGKGQGHTSEN
ncbi:uncharacterized protein IL334_001513 [Kwoniella shivajii]|uniref:Uncharacterized protein n=1 Tax=Kwoniella shivajii TaxID=564305 RepID=A0ABZ1CV74_9TREE|nr:hypothetical protein IL334_001513 [Kwoniella shivajii]